MPKLTAKVLKDMKPDTIVRDTVRGFFAQAGRTDPPLISLRAQCDLKGPPARSQKATFAKGRAAELDIEAARGEAMAWIASIKRGVNPRKPPPTAAGAGTVAVMFTRAGQYLAAQGRAERTRADLAWLAKHYWEHWAARTAVEVKPSELRSEHERITRESGPVAANKAVRAFRQAWNIMARQADDAVPANPVRGVTFHRQRASEAVIEPEDLKDWFQRLGTISNPARRLLHELGLFSALRPGLLVQIERSWIDLDRAVILVPRARMKVNQGRPDFSLPLSAHMVGLCRTALDLAEITHRGGRWLWPTQGKGGDWQATVVWRESKLDQTGHILRATWRTVAKIAGVDDFLASCLMDHAAGDMRDVYIRSGIWTPLLEAQERATARLLALTRPGPLQSGEQK